MSIILITSYYRTENSERNSEIDYVLRRNVSSGLFEKIILFCDPTVIPNISHESIQIFDFIGRPKYSDFFHKGNEYEGKYIVIANSDIFFDESILKIKRFSNDRFLAITRYEYEGSDNSPNIYMKMGCDSQDTWIYKSPANINDVEIDFHLGTPGCDNRIAYEMSKNYKVINPSLSVKTYHMHSSKYRTYDVSNRIDGPYLQVHIR